MHATYRVVQGVNHSYWKNQHIPIFRFEPTPTLLPFWPFCSDRPSEKFSLTLRMMTLHGMTKSASIFYPVRSDGTSLSLDRAPQNIWMACFNDAAVGGGNSVL